jgi:hypothetical protein
MLLPCCSYCWPGACSWFVEHKVPKAVERDIYSYLQKVRRGLGLGLERPRDVAWA